MKILSRFILPIFAVASIFSEAPLKGRLENGMTYYIHKNAYPKGSVDMRLVVKAGSLDENEDERGLAHFVEHMVFRGTTNFKDYEIKDFIDSMGGKFGHHSNAFTSFDTTEYFLTLPQYSSQNIDKGLKILNEMMFYAKFDSDLLEKERGIVLSEKSMQNVSHMSYFEKILKFYNLAHLKDRMPIGKEELIRNVTPQRMRTFYERQYRPSKMAIIVTGDFEPSETLKRVQSIFTKNLAPLVDSKSDRQLTNPQDIQIISHTDSKMGYNGIMLAKQIAVLKGNRFSDEVVKESIIKEFCSQYISKNLTLKQKEGRSYLYGALMPAQYSNNHTLQLFSFWFKGESAIEATKQFHDDMNAICSSHVDDESLNAFLEAKIHDCEQQIKNDHLIPNAVWVGQFRDDFIFGRGIASYVNQNEALVSLSACCTKEDTQRFLLRIKGILNTANYVTLTTTSEPTCSLEALKEAVQESRILKQSVSKEAREIEDLVVDLGEAQESAIIWQKQDIGCFEATLKNGLKLIFHPISEQKGAAQFCLLAKSGRNTLTKKELETIDFAISVAGDSGLSNLNQHEFITYLQKKGIRLGACQMSILQKSIRGSFRSESLSETMKIVSAIFNHKQFDQKSFDCAVSNAKSMEESFKNNEDVAFQKWLRNLRFGGHALFQESEASNADFEVCKTIFEEAYANPSEFTMIISGDLSQEALDKALVKYLSALKDKGSTKPEIQQSEIQVPAGEHTFCHTSKQGSFGYMLLPMTKASYTFGRCLEANLLSKIITERLFQLLRLDEAKSYAQGVGLTPSVENFDQLSLFLYFVADDEFVEDMHEKSMNMLENLCKNGISAEELTAAKAKLFEEIVLQDQAPFRYMSLHEKRVIHGYSQGDLMGKRAFIDNKINVANIDALLKELNTSQYLRVSKVLG